jgi:hypothetical protein
MFKRKTNLDHRLGKRSFGGQEKGVSDSNTPALTIFP